MEDEWAECLSDESNRSGYEYKYEEDAETSDLKKLKRLKKSGD